MLLDKFCGYINDLFSVQTIKDYSNNGLQVEGRGDISKVAFSVDASMDGFEKAAAVGADIIIVHHGLFWGQPLMISGYHRRRVQFLLDNEISLYALHLPLIFTHIAPFAFLIGALFTLARMEKQISTIQDDFQKLLESNHSI